MRTVGKVFKITGSRVHQIVGKMIRKYWPCIYKNIQIKTKDLNGYNLVSITKLRKEYKNRLLFDLKEQVFFQYRQ